MTSLENALRDDTRGRRSLCDELGVLYATASSLVRANRGLPALFRAYFTLLSRIATKD
jgi:hypothetical protein